MLSCLLTTLLLAGCGKPFTIEGTIAPITKREPSVAPPTDSKPYSAAWRAKVLVAGLRTFTVPIGGAEVLAVAEDDLKRLVQEYNREIGSKSAEYKSRYTAADRRLEAAGSQSGSGIHPLAVNAEWQQLKASALWDRLFRLQQGTSNSASPIASGIVGLSGGNAFAKSMPDAGGFRLATADSQGRFKLTLPHRGSWCFFVIANTDIGQCYYFKQKTFLLGRSVKFDGLDKLTSIRHSLKDAGQVAVIDDPIQSKEDFIRTFLKYRYGLADPDIAAE